MIASAIVDFETITTLFSFHYKILNFVTRTEKHNMNSNSQFDGVPNNQDKYLYDYLCHPEIHQIVKSTRNIHRRFCPQCDITSQNLVLDSIEIMNSKYFPSDENAVEEKNHEDKCRE